MLKLEKLLRTAYQYQASDVYITTGSKPILRIHGDLVNIEEHAVLTKSMAEGYILEIMTESQRKCFEKNLDIDFSFEAPKVTRFRVNIFVQRKGIGATFRLIPERVKTIDELDLPSQIKKIAQFKNGLVLITGPAGSGKSSTLAAILDEINSQKNYHIVTIEDPIEFTHENKKSIIEQREVGTHTQSFQQALRASLREDSNVVLIGELRDYESFSLALTAAETGHLILSTVHTSGVENAINRIIDSFPSDQQNQIRAQLSESLKAVMWQNLVKRKNKPGRIAAMEIMFQNKAISNLIRKGHIHQIPSIVETRLKDGMHSMEQSLKQLAAEGHITEEEAIQNTPDEIELS